MRSKLLMVTVLGLMFTFSKFAFADNDESEAKIAIPATVSAIWQSVQDQEKQLQDVISNKKLDQVHHFAFAIRDLINALPDKSSDLPADKLEVVKTYAKYIAAIASRLDETGDGGDQAGTEANFVKLQDLLKKIEGQYPSQ